jgi:hypothetical protein
MLTVSPAIRIYLATGATDLRRSIDGLSVVVRDQLQLDPLSGHLFLLSAEHFTVDGTLLEAWASQKSFRPRDEDRPDAPAGGNPDVNFRGAPRRNDTHQSTTDPDARLAKKGPGREAKLSYAGHVLMENRHGFVVDTRLTPADGYAEIDAALVMLEALPPRSGITVAGDKAYDAVRFVDECRHIGRSRFGCAFARRAA